MKYLRKKLFMLFIFIQSCVVFNAFSASWLGTVAGNFSQYTTQIAQLGRTNKQLIEELARNISAAAITATTDRLQTNPIADHFYFIPKAGSPEYTDAALPGIQAVVAATRTLVAAVTARFDVVAGEATAIELRNSGIAGALQNLVTKLTTDFLSVYNQNPAALRGIQEIENLFAITAALTTQATRLGALAQYAEHVNAIHTIATNINGVTQSNIALARQAEAQALAIQAATLAVAQHIAAGSTLAAQLAADTKTINDKVASLNMWHAAVENPQGTFHAAVEHPAAGAPADIEKKFITLITTPLDTFADQAAETITNETISNAFKRTTQNVVIAVKADAQNTHVLRGEPALTAFIAALNEVINADCVKLRTKTAERPNELSLVCKLQGAFTHTHMQNALTALVNTPNIADMTEDVMLAQLRDALRASVLEQVKPKGFRAWVKSWFSSHDYTPEALQILNAIFGNAAPAPAPAPAPIDVAPHREEPVIAPDQEVAAPADVPARVEQAPEQAPKEESMLATLVRSTLGIGL